MNLLVGRREHHGAELIGSLRVLRASAVNVLRAFILILSVAWVVGLPNNSRMAARVPVTIPTLFKKFTGGVGLIEVEALTVRELLDRLVALHPGLAGQLVAADGSQHRFLNIFINGLDIRFIDGLDSALSAGDEVQLVPAIAGGCLCWVR